MSFFFAQPEFVCQSGYDRGARLYMGASCGPNRLGRIPLPARRLLGRTGICMTADSVFATTSFWRGRRLRKWIRAGSGRKFVEGDGRIRI